MSTVSPFLFFPRQRWVTSAPPPHTPHTNSIIKSMGLSIADFNTITRRLAQDPRLRQRVLKQAYLYRLEAKINDKCVRLFSLPV